MLSTQQFTLEALSPLETPFTSALSPFPSDRPCPFFTLPLHVAPYLLLRHFLQLLALCTCTLAPFPASRFLFAEPPFQNQGISNWYSLNSISVLQKLLIHLVKSLYRLLCLRARHSCAHRFGCPADIRSLACLLQPHCLSFQGCSPLNTHCWPLWPEPCFSPGLFTCSFRALGPSKSFFRLQGLGYSPSS